MPACAAEHHSVSVSVCVCVCSVYVNVYLYPNFNTAIDINTAVHAMLKMSSSRQVLVLIVSRETFIITAARQDQEQRIDGTGAAAGPSSS